VKAWVDDDKCQGHMRCAIYAEKVFGVDDQGHAFVEPATVPAEFEKGVRLAELNCPEQAIRVEG
jgi:ferredoxin